MKRLLRLQEARTGRRNVTGRRMINKILRGGGLVVDTRSGNICIELDQMSEAGRSMTSSHGRIFTGRLESVPVIVKMPSSKKAIAGWKNEVSITNRMSEAGIAPEVYVQSPFPGHEFVIMQRYDWDLFTHMLRTLDLPEHKHREEGNRVKEGLRDLIARIAKYHENNPEKSVCIGDFRMENIVIDASKYEMKQIDFDSRFCAAPETLNEQLGAKLDVELLMMLCLTFSYNQSNADGLAGVFPTHGRVFLDELLARKNDVLALVDALEPLESSTMKNLRYLLLEGTFGGRSWADVVRKSMGARDSPVSVVDASDSSTPDSER